MSLFPAYSGCIRQQDEVVNKTAENSQSDSKNTPEWLNNSSFKQISSALHIKDADEISSISSSSEEDITTNSNLDQESNKPCTSEIMLKSKKRKKLKKKKKVSCNKDEKKEVDNHLYFKDKFRNTMFLTIDTIKDMRPKYLSTNKYKLGFKSYDQFKKKHRRYYAVNLDMPKYKKGNETNNAGEDEEVKNQKNKIQEEQKQKVEEFNRKLQEKPDDIETWIEYIQFQDEAAKLHNSFYFENKNIKYLTNQKKLSIVEKAIKENSTSNELLKLKLFLMHQLMPADQYANEVEQMIQRDSKNIILWENLITSIQTSCALCTVRKVTDMYVKCFQILRQKSKVDAKFYDKQVIRLLYQCLTFFRHTGLWEQMWEIIKINLCLNLEINIELFETMKTIDEKELINLEEVILTSRLPINQLWLRIESLRESCHWTGIDPEKVEIDLIGDPKRLVSSSDTADYVYPMLTKESNFRLAILCLLALKVPLIPTRHCTLINLGIEEIFWSIESLEYILPMIYSIAKETDSTFQNGIFVKELIEGQLTSGPQYIKFHPAQEVFLDFIRSVFQTVATNLSDNKRTSILVWWLKFERLLCFIVKHDPLVDKRRNKKLKLLVKDFLRVPENRNNMHFYREYALLEYELGNTETSIQVLETIIDMQEKIPLNLEEKLAVISLYRTYLEILLNTRFYDKDAIDHVIQRFHNFLSLLSKHRTDSLVKILKEQIEIFLENPVQPLFEEEVFLPNVYCDMLVWYAYLKYLRTSDFLEDVLLVFDKCINHSESDQSLTEKFIEEKLRFVQFCYQRDHNFKNILVKLLHHDFIKFPYNFYFLSTNAVVESKLPCWQFSVKKPEMQIWSAFAKCLALRNKICYLKNISLEDAYKATVNKLLSFHRMMSNKQEIKGCPLIWRLYMLLLQEYNLSKMKGEEVYYEAVAECPWARSVYVSAAEVAPQILSQIQDLIKEKELRIHVTPEELEILRGS